MRTLLTASARCAALGLPGALRPLVDEPLVGFACADLETTGTDTARDRIVSVAIVLLGPDGSEEERWSRIVDPGVPIPPGVSRIHGITDETVRGMPRFADLADEVEERITGRVLTAFNARFDHRLLELELGRAGRDFRPAGEGCALQAVQVAYPLAPAHHLDAATGILGLASTAVAHDALEDALATAGIVRSMVEEGLDPTGTELDLPAWFWLRSRISDRAVTERQLRRLFAVARHADRLLDRNGLVDEGLLLGEAARVAGVSRLEDLTGRQVQDLFDAIEPDGDDRRDEGERLLAALACRPGRGRRRDGERRWPEVA